MKQVFTFLLMSFVLIVHGQQMDLAEWNEQSEANIRLLPRYGHKQKTGEQRQSDRSFVDEMLQQERFKGDRTAASNHMIGLGFDYLYRGDMKTAMYRFNQAYLLDSSNTDIYWGYGGVYMTLGAYDQARVQYEEGLSNNPDNTHLLTDLATYFMTQYQALYPLDIKIALSKLDTAVTLLTRSFERDPKDQNTTFKLSACYLMKGDCDNAWKYHDACKSLGGKPMPPEYTNDLVRKCKKKR